MFVKNDGITDGKMYENNNQLETCGKDRSLKYAKGLICKKKEGQKDKKKGKKKKMNHITILDT